MIKEVDYPSEGAMLRGLLFLPESQSESPALVTKAHGTSATVTMVADKYADAPGEKGGGRDALCADTVDLQC
jgi:uncharacterized protein